MERGAGFSIGFADAFALAGSHCCFVDDGFDGAGDVALRLAGLEDEA
jgi:hypothetical protein